MKATNQYAITEGPKPDLVHWSAWITPGTPLEANPANKNFSLLQRVSEVLATNFEMFSGTRSFKVKLRDGDVYWASADSFLDPATGKPDETEKSHLKALPPASLLDQAIEAAERAHQALNALGEEMKVGDRDGYAPRLMFRQANKLSDITEWLKERKPPPNTSDARAREEKTPEDCRLGGKTTTFGGSAGILPDHLG